MRTAFLQGMDWHQGDSKCNVPSHFVEWCRFVFCGKYRSFDGIESWASDKLSVQSPTAGQQSGLLFPPSDMQHRCMLDQCARLSQAADRIAPAQFRTATQES